jgi:thiol-disulfide isomerase/thioredoxin
MNLYMKKILLLLLCLPAALWAFQKQKPATKPNNLTLVCRVYGLKQAINLDSLNLYESVGLGNRLVARAGRRSGDSAYVFTLPMAKARFYSVGVAEVSTSKIVLGEEKEVSLWGNIQRMDKARTLNSPANKAFEDLRKQISDFAAQSVEFRAQYNAATGTLRKPAEARLKELNERKARFLDSLKTANPLMQRYASLYLNPEFEGQGNELDFVSKEFFRHANLSDPAFEEVPDVFTAFENFVAQLMQTGAAGEQLVKLAEAPLAKIPTNSLSYRRALSGIVSGLKNGSSPEYLGLARRYIDTYRSQPLGEISALQNEVRKAGTFSPGFEAPDLAGMTPDSNSFSLNQLRGKIVMIDFWASWCGPCRRENPNVVANYKKYNEKGFDILGVSLDREIGAWRKAIQQDGLPWHHISDLKGWQSAHAALYSVTSIPQTVLLDREGKIIARNLRGEELGNKLKELFGE